MRRLCILTALFVVVTAPVRAQSAPTPEQRRADYLAVVRAYASQVVAARVRHNQVVFEAPSGPRSGQVMGGTDVVAYQQQGLMVAIASEERGVIGWVPAGALDMNPGERTRAVRAEAGTAYMPHMQPDAAARQAAIYDSLRMLPPSLLSERDLQWMQIYQTERQTQNQAQAVRSGDRASKAISGYLAFVVATSIAALVAGVALALSGQ